MMTVERITPADSLQEGASFPFPPSHYLPGTPQVAQNLDRGVKFREEIVCRAACELISSFPP